MTFCSICLLVNTLNRPLSTADALLFEAHLRSVHGLKAMEMEA